MKRILPFFLQSVFTLFFVFSFSSCKDDEEEEFHTNMEVIVELNGRFNSLSLGTTVVKLTSVSDGKEYSFVLDDSNNRVVFDNIKCGIYLVEAYRKLSSDELEIFGLEPSEEFYLAGSEIIEADNKLACRVYLTLNPDSEHAADVTLMVNEFINFYMDEVYFWNKEMPYIKYWLEADPELYFYKLLKQPDDRWSFITDDIFALEEYYQGISKSMGYSLQPYYFAPGSNQVVVFVEYVYRNSPAEKAGLKRGDMFFKINGTVINDLNYQQLLSLDNMRITLGQISHGAIIPLEPEVEITAIEGFHSHPVIASNILETGNKKVAYLAYSSFLSNYDTAVVNRFSEFKAAGVDELVLDLRYNGGGSVNSAIMLGSHIVPSNLVGKTFIREVWNDNLKSFNEELKFKKVAANLDLNRVYILTTEHTASASEMIIYGLAPYIEVIQIGATTYGKYYAAVVLSDNNSEPEKRRHSWAIQPIVYRSENSDNSIDYSRGLAPKYELDDNRYDAQLGDEDEYFLCNALSLINTGTMMMTAPKLKSASENFIPIQNYKIKNDPLYGTMIREQGTMNNEQ